MDCMNIHELYAHIITMIYNIILKHIPGLTRYNILQHSSTIHNCTVLSIRVSASDDTWIWATYNLPTLEEVASEETM